jgi:hypothetical protein
MFAARELARRPDRRTTARGPVALVEMSLDEHGQVEFVVLGGRSPR